MARVDIRHDEGRMMTGHAGGRSRDSFFFWFSVYAVVVAVAGFARTFIHPFATGTGSFDVVVLAHGAFFFGWVIWLLAQATWVRRRQMRVHRAMGWASIPVAVGMVVSCVAVGVTRAKAEIAGGPQGGHVDGLFGVVTAMAGFALLYAAAVALRRRPETHKRLLVLATIAILWPAWFRFRHYFPDVPRPDIVFGLLANDLAIIALMAHDRLRDGRVHPVSAWVGGALLLDHVVETSLFGTPVWSELSRMVLAFFV